MQTPAQVARTAHVTPQSIRNWSREYAELLSPQASGATGQRLYTDEDVQILCLIADLRKSGVPRDQVAERIRNGELPPIIEVEATPQQSLNEPQNGLNEGAYAPLAMQISYTALQGQIDALTRQFEAKRVDEIRQAEMRGATLALVAGGFVLWCLWLATNGL